ncbi:MAG TPA: HNH endonuclease [Cyanobacteria bacterium UBA11149]|nr:HNH endonuclease [Cyanobacteria bacterium UBA11367]HBE58393.1 HNH endonuclease [Cyanobacteria bacterium UBA11366]HBK63619.1 HNH endonuclease [Cyanobacteria bacterium UBA11166]HBR73115.1 HNH endonuclease [Cyanobacteria bacterium UBA11159]HBS68025.1 HNH endonuclease [Cyanobacteria bacterium UBA11153]HBW88436.1 HNH endonuclease [Cyanobacteria bacterium UBA11149]HCA93455.1 HNH endonuclease [Cyanobacteria bacterium UBA9226]
MTISEELRARVRAKYGNCCSYCQSLQKYILGILEIDHIIPKAAGGNDDEKNLCLACSLCNKYKGIQTHAVNPITQEQVKLFNPHTQKWWEHFAWSENGTEIIGLTDCGSATVIALKLNNKIAVTVRQQWVSAGWHPQRWCVS